MYFRHSAEIWRDFPRLAAGVIFADGIDATTNVDDRVEHFLARAGARLDGTSEAALPEIQAWRRAYAQLRLKPTQYRCASEALLRR